MATRIAPADRQIGERIREARIACGMSQGALGDLIGVSYQQVQKYESGHNRINGARIGNLVTALNRPLAYFFPDATDVRFAPDPSISALLQTKEGLTLARAFSRITALPDRRMVVELASRLAEAGEQDG
jgi:transcriptional regulator with XRE-family HTH domain